jgi:hypothetical protein
MSGICVIGLSTTVSACNVDRGRCVTGGSTPGGAELGNCPHDDVSVTYIILLQLSGHSNTILKFFFRFRE